MQFRYCHDGELVGVVTTLAGSYGSSSGVDGVGSSANFVHPFGMALDSNSIIYLSDVGSHSVRKVTTAGKKGYFLLHVVCCMLVFVGLATTLFTGVDYNGLLVQDGILYGTRSHRVDQYIISSGV